MSRLLCENKGPPLHSLKEATQSVSCPGFLLRQSGCKSSVGWGVWCPMGRGLEGMWTQHARWHASVTVGSGPPCPAGVWSSGRRQECSRKEEAPGPQMSFCPGTRVLPGVEGLCGRRPHISEWGVGSRILVPQSLRPILESVNLLAHVAKGTWQMR